MKYSDSFTLYDTTNLTSLQPHYENIPIVGSMGVATTQRDDRVRPFQTPRTIEKDELQTLDQLAGGEEVPILEIAQSHNQAAETQAVWDVDGIIAQLDCLSACYGMGFSFYPKIVWNIQSDMHVSIQGRVLYKTPHIRLWISS